LGGTPGSYTAARLGNHFEAGCRALCVPACFFFVGLAMARKSSNLLIRYSTGNKNNVMNAPDASICAAARELLAAGADPRASIELWWPGATEWALRAKIGIAAELTVAEGDRDPPRFRKWKPFQSLLPERQGSASLRREGKPYSGFSGQVGVTLSSSL
jgi:hypothetical protein